MSVLKLMYEVCGSLRHFLLVWFLFSCTRYFLLFFKHWGFIPFFYCLFLLSFNYLVLSFSSVVLLLIRGDNQTKKNYCVCLRARVFVCG